MFRRVERVVGVAWALDVTFKLLELGHAEVRRILRTPNDLRAAVNGAVSELAVSGWMPPGGRAARHPRDAR